ncbi:glutathione S-transferase family protein [Aureimonas fodinaquatilis]|uniref:Glutathione S-transferase family protein n=1 Tax=Aureimonas fodinaquatilis TaxID=2565783 RepID=A0A5B0E0X8_9HYPH|nr:glutathione S-transferase family protein [Aureimonas fodinaquatilis]KAA0971775.1 glutathione S-transferase family protein [Aureimonas fodinaquatilis]
MAELTFYTNPMSRGRMVRWLLEELGVPYETRVIAYGPEMKSAEYLAINPMGKVPAIQHKGQVVTEVAAICAYLADAFPQAGLAPAVDSPARASYYRWLFFGAGPMEYAISNQACGFVPDEKQRRFVGYGSMAEVLNALEQVLSANDYLAGTQFTAADVYVGSQIGWGMQFKTIEPRPVFEAYWQRLVARPAAQRAAEIDNALLEAKG